ncbi:MAG: class I SAM-dependent methyltransferase [Saprospiraceae bacterium]|jgi:SAM-dependent methyltransferase
MRQWIFSGVLLALLSVCTGCKWKNGRMPPEAPIAPPTDALPLPGLEEDYLHTNRVIWQKPEVVIDLLGDIGDKTIADIGAGSGFFALRLAPLSKKVIAIDIEPRFVHYLDSIRQVELAPEVAQRLEPRLAEPKDAHLQPEEADIVLIVNTYMYIEHRVAYLRKLAKGIRPDGKVLIIDFKKKRSSLGPKLEIRVPQFQVEEELESAGFQILQSNDTALDYQYIILAVKK